MSECGWYELGFRQSDDNKRTTSKRRAIDRSDGEEDRRGVAGGQRLIQGPRSRFVRKLNMLQVSVEQIRSRLGAIGARKARYEQKSNTPPHRRNFGSDRGTLYTVMRLVEDMQRLGFLTTPHAFPRSP